ncbi:unnamed protein product [Cylindrotheca closterium]|uniref:Cyclin N-terminal domain-containing protein n=1 Tax=Cylindrotheca closterium TaxID=2856 RepID=A0AAD2FPX3_9STRA|nr:unnamed protein product [Cylindrotheca closterium]
MTSTQRQLDDQKHRSKDGADGVIPSKTMQANKETEDSDQQDALESIRTMLNREQTSYVIQTADDNLSSANKPFSAFVKPIQRKRMIEWCLAMVGTMELRRETIERAINLIDRFILLKGGRILLSDPILYQRAVITALYIMIKCHEEEAIPIEDMAYVCGGGDDNGKTSAEDLAHTSEQLEAMEVVLLNELQWEINPPTSFEYIAHFLKLLKLPVSDRLFDTVQQDDHEEDEGDEGTQPDEADDSETKWLFDLVTFEVEEYFVDYDCWKKGAFHNAYNAFMDVLPMRQGGEELAQRLASLLAVAVPELERYRSTHCSSNASTSTTSHTSSRLGIVGDEAEDASSLAGLDYQSASSDDDDDDDDDDSSDDGSSSDDSASMSSSETSSVSNTLPEGEPLETVISISITKTGSSTETQESFISQHTRTALGNIKLDLEDNESPACVMDRGLSTLMQTSLVAQTADLLDAED